MKKIFTVIALIMIFGTEVQAQYQYIDTVIQYFNQEWKEVSKKEYFTYFRIARKLPDSTWHVRDYFAEDPPKLQMEGVYLDDSFKIEHGRFYYYHYNGNVWRECTYNKGKYVGLYRSYAHNGALLDSTRYKSTGIPFNKSFHWDGKGKLISYAEYDMEGKGTGYETVWWRDSVVSVFGKYTEGHLEDSVWTYYYRNGNVSMHKTYNAGKIIDYVCYDIKGNIQKDCDTSIRMPQPDYNVNIYLAKNIKMPMEAKQEGLLGTFKVFLLFLVDTDGKIIDVEVQNNTHDFFMKEALRVVSTLPPWKPARGNNRNMQAWYTLPVNFRLE